MPSPEVSTQYIQNKVNTISRETNSLMQSVDLFLKKQRKKEEAEMKMHSLGDIDPSEHRSIEMSEGESITLGFEADGFETAQGLSAESLGENDLGVGSFETVSADSDKESGIGEGEMGESESAETESGGSETGGSESDGGDSDSE